jgi:hypothetical protein
MALRSDVATVLGELARRHQVARGELSKRFHRIKDRGDTPGTTDVNWIDDLTGDVYDGPHGQPGQYIGNLFDDF